MRHIHTFETFSPRKVDDRQSRFAMGYIVLAYYHAPFIFWAKKVQTEQEAIEATRKYLNTDAKTKDYGEPQFWKCFKPTGLYYCLSWENNPFKDRPETKMDFFRTENEMDVYVEDNVPDGWRCYCDTLTELREV